MIPTRDYVRENLSYDPLTGVMRWIKPKPGRRIGRVAGCDNGDGYLVIRLDKVLYKAHRLAWLHATGSFPEGHIDHINQKKSDNRLCNLRDVSNRDNGMNCRLGKNNTSGVCGVSWDKGKMKWNAYAKVDGKHKNLGYFTSISDAAAARQEANIKYGFHENHGAPK